MHTITTEPPIYFHLLVFFTLLDYWSFQVKGEESDFSPLFLGGTVTFCLT